MHKSNKLFQIQYFHLKSHSKLSQSSLFLILLVLAGSLAGCVIGPIPTKDMSPTPIENCFPSSVFTAKDMQASVDCHPNEYKLTISKDTVVLFAFPNSIIDWVGPIFIIHIPSVSEVVVNTNGSLFFKDYKSPEGQAAIERVLNNSELMARILQRATQIQKGTLVPPTPTR